MSKPWNLRFMEYIGFSVKSDSILLPLFRSSPTPTRKPTRQISQCCIACLGTSEPPLWMDILGTCTEPPPCAMALCRHLPVCSPWSITSLSTIRVQEMHVLKVSAICLGMGSLTCGDFYVPFRVHPYPYMPQPPVAAERPSALDVRRCAGHQGKRKPLF